MTGQRTAAPFRLTEHHKARVRLVLLLIIGIACPPLADVRSTIVWVFYAAFLIIYSLWALRLIRSFSLDRRLGYLLVLTDTAVLLPLLAWASSSILRVILALLAAAGLVATYGIDRQTRRAALLGNKAHTLRPRAALTAPDGKRIGTALERALRVRLRILDATQTRFAVVVLRILRFEEISTYYGESVAEHLTAAVIRRSLRLLGADAQHFVLPQGRVALVFSTGAGSTHSVASDDSLGEWIDPYDVESFAMSLARKVCEHLVDGHRVECVVGWASAPADGMTADDLMYAAESGAQSAAAFRRVAGAPVPVPEKTRAVAG